MATTDELLDNLMKDYKKPEDLIGENGLLKQLPPQFELRLMETEKRSSRRSQDDLSSINRRTGREEP